MAYTIKADPFGAGTTPTMLVAVDPDTNTIKEFASSAVNADMVVGANVTIGSQSWDGNTRSYFLPGSGTTAADIITFGTNKPNWTFNASGQKRTVVWIGEVAGLDPRVFGKDTNNYFAGSQLGAGGTTHPAMSFNASPRNGGQVRPASTSKVIFGWTMEHGVSMNWYTALHDAVSMTTGSASVYSGTSTSGNYDIDRLQALSTGFTHQQDKVHAIAIFPAVLSQANWDSLRDDWFTALLESSGASAALNKLSGLLAGPIHRLT